MEASPAALGFRLPAEWESHEATWIAWPHNVTDWPGRFAPIPWVYSEFARKITPGEIVRIIVDSQAHENRARRVLSRAGVDLSRVEFFRFPTDRGWTRDSGPIFLKRPASPSIPQIQETSAAAPQCSSEVAVIRFRFNAWAKYPEWRNDDALPEQAAQALNLRVFQAKAGNRDLVLEGGSIDTNGQGTLLSTEECLLDTKVQARNPDLSQQDLETALRDNLGVSNILWLGRGIAGDDTHGHVDDLCRFVNSKTAVLCHEDNSNDANYLPLEENRERLEGMHLEDGSRIEIVPLPMPAPLYFDGQRLPASYANFYISNAAVLVPTFNDPNDRIALGTLAELFPSRVVVGIHAVDLVWGLGTVHCLTQQQPAMP
ncbi:MAG: agmatine deiminase family protein [Acidobacteria bacterium]|nr:agmatine deiminase family protein [Acidobacteriota bacterium]